VHADSEQTPDLNSDALRLVFRELVRDDGYVAHSLNWVEFLSVDAYMHVEVELGRNEVLHIDAELLQSEDTLATESEVIDWIDKQPRPLLGSLTSTSVALEDGSHTFRPAVQFDVRVDSLVHEFIEWNIAPFAEAWDGRKVARIPGEEKSPAAVEFYRFDPVSIAPQNAWLLMGDEASYPSAEELATTLSDSESGIYDTVWTAPKNGEASDLVLVYFIAPLRSACFVGRLASRPFWLTDVEVNAVDAVERHQWWAYITPLIEIEPISFAALKQAQNGYLNLRGRSGHYLRPEAIEDLTFVAKDPGQQLEVDRIAQTPTGLSELPGAGGMSFEEWKHIPSGQLPLEAKVSEYVVEPLQWLVWSAPKSGSQQDIQPTLGPIARPEHRVPGGYVDFVFEYGFVPVLAVEVKLSILRPASGVWKDSPDFQQLKRYTDHLRLPGLLVDAHSILLVRDGEDEPFAEIVRADATWEDIALVRDLVLEGWTAARPPASSPARIARRVANRG
jgi:hypothetical protein